MEDDMTWVPVDIREGSWCAHDFPERPVEPYYTWFCGCGGCEVAMMAVIKRLPSQRKGQ